MTVSCYSTPETIPIFIDDRTFKFQFRGVPAVPSVLHATSGARAIGLRHFLLVKCEELNRNPRRTRVQVLQGIQTIIHHIQHIANIPAQPFLNHPAVQNANQGTQGHGWTFAGMPQQALPAPPPQGLNAWSMVPFNLQTASQAQNNSNVLGAVHQQNPQNVQAQGSFPPWIQNQLAQPFANFGGLQQTAGPGSGFQNNFQNGSHHQAQGSFAGNFHSQFISPYQNSFGGSQQTTAAGGPHYQSPYGGNVLGNAVGQHNATHHGAQQHSIFGGSFQSAPVGQHNTTQAGQQQSIFGGSFQLAPVGQHNATQAQSVFGGNLQSAHTGQQLIGPYSHVVGQGITLQLTNPAAGFNAPSANLANVTNTVVQNNQPRLLSVDDNTDDDSDRYFYVNPGSDCFKLQVGARTGCNYPTYSLTRFPQLVNTVSDEDRQTYLQLTQRAYVLPTQFPAPGRLPKFLGEIYHLAINLELAPCHAPMRSDGFKIWLQDQTKTFCEVVIKSTLKKFRGVKHLDLLIEEASHTRPSHALDRMVFRYFRQAHIQEEDGITFGHAELGLLEREIRLWMMSEYMGKNGCEGPDVRIVVHVPEYS